MLNLEHNNLLALTPSIALMRSLQVFNSDHNPNLNWPPKSVMSQPFSVIIKFLRGFAFKNLVNNKENSDVTFIVDNDKIYCHRSLLSSRSPFFNKQFDPSKSYQEILIENVPKDLFFLVLEYMVINSNKGCSFIV
jgi:hypothetical protein